MRKCLSFAFILILFALVDLPGWAQQSQTFEISGLVLDSVSGKPVAYATIAINDERGNTISSGFTKESGSLNLKIDRPGNYILIISSIGYQVKNISLIVSVERKTYLLGDINISSSNGDLQEIKVSGARKIIDVQPGRIIYNAANDVTNKGGTAADVLRKAPVLNVDAQGNVSMRGNSNLKILINGKFSGQMARSPADALQMMPADIIQSVEIITTPSAKYDAEGAAGVINIITKKGRKDFNGAIELSGSNFQQMINPRIGFTNGNWNFSFHGHLHRFRTKESYDLNRIQLENGTAETWLKQSSWSDNTAPHGSGDIAIVFTPDSSSEFSFGMNGWFGKWPDNRKIETESGMSNGTITDKYLQQTTANENYLGTDLTLGYNRKFRRPGTELTLLLQYNPSRSKSPYNTILSDLTDIPYYEELNDNNTRSREWTLQADYSQPVSANGNHSLETGFKLILRNAINKYVVSTNDNPATGGTLIPDPSRSDEFDYAQNVYAFYLMEKSNFKNNWYAEAGARLEETQLTGDFKSGSAFDNRFFNFIPTATISKKLDEENTITLSYTQRLTRPYIWDLNPNADASDPKNIVVGNPELKPEIAHQAELVYGLNKGSAFFLNSSLYWKQTNNAMIEYTETNAEGVSTTSMQNLATNKTYGLNFSASSTINSVWSLNGNININYLDYAGKALQVYSAGWAADGNINLTVKFSQSYFLQIFGEYSTREILLQGYNSQQFMYSAALRKDFKKPKISVTAAIVNPFNKYIPQAERLFAPSFNSVTDNRYYQRSLRITLNWEFGKMFETKESRKVSNDDVKGLPKG